MTTFAEAEHPATPAPGTQLWLPQVLVAMRWWRGVSVRRAVPVAMTPLERFTLELALTMGRAEPDEFFEITGLPATLLPVTARRLVNSGALASADGGYVPVRPVADVVVRSQTVHEERHARLDIVLLPRTGDLLALDSRSSWLRAADQLRPRSVGNAPVPADLRGRRLAEHLTQRLAEGTVAGVGEDVTGVAVLDGESPPIDSNGWCPVYRCEGSLHLDGDRYVPKVLLTGAGGREPVAAQLPGADGLTARWREVADILGQTPSRAQAWNLLTGRPEYTAPRAERINLGRWRCFVGGGDARRLADRGRNLAAPLGLAVREEDLVAEVSIELVAGDSTAADLIALDCTLSAAAEPGADTDAVPRTRAVRDRAWQLGFHGLAYTLREAEDFAYG